MRKIGLMILAALLLPLCACTPNGQLPDGEDAAKVGANDIVISPAGDDKAAGTEAAPLATLAAAKELAKTRAGEEPLTVWLRAGVYRLSETLKFDASDRNNVTYRAYGDGEVSLSATRPVTGWSETTVNGVTAWVADAGEDTGFTALFDAETSLPRPRYPAEGFLYVRNYDREDLLDPASQDGAHTGAFIAEGEELLDFKNPTDVMVYLPHNWTAERSPLAKVEVDTGRVTLQKRTGYAEAFGDRFYFDNVFEALDSPGEWYLDRPDGKLYYIPRAGEQREGFTLYAGTTEYLMTIEGMRGLTFRDITFRDTNVDDEIIACGQSEYCAPGALMITGCDGLAFADCSFRNLGMSGLRYVTDNRNCSVTGCTFRETGGTAISIYGDNLPREDERVSHDFVITDNLIEGYGRNYRSGAGILLCFAHTAEISRNEIHDGYYTGISAGLVWDNGYHVTGDIRITDNLIYDVGQFYMSDMGGIYTLGEQPGTVIEGNVIHDVNAYDGEGGYGGHGIYLDQGSSFMTLRNNLVYNCQSAGFFHSGLAKELVIDNNIFAFCGTTYCGINLRGGSMISTPTFTNNIALSGDGSFFDEAILNHSYPESGNLYYNLSSPDDEYAVGQHAGGAVFADPLFADPENGDFTLPENSPALAAGFTPWDYSAAGRRGD